MVSLTDGNSKKLLLIPGLIAEQGAGCFEVNIWMWKYGRPFQRKFSVEEAVALRKRRVQESSARGAATLQRRQARGCCHKNGRARAINVNDNGISERISYTISYPICVTK